MHLLWNVPLALARIALMLLLWRSLRALGVSALGAGVGVVMLMLGNAAFSLLPHVPYEHDYPLLMNTSIGSLSAIAGAVIVSLYVCDQWGPQAHEVSGRRFQWTGLVVPGAFLIAFGVLLVGARASHDPGVAPQKSMTAVGITDPSWWYLPAGQPGFATGFGNLPIDAVAMGTASPAALPPFNDIFLSRARQPGVPSAYKAVALIYLVELRVFEIIQALWFPLVGVLGLGWIVVSRPPEDPAARLRVFFVITGVVFAVGLGAVLVASPGDGSLSAKWALSRLLEPGIGLAMLAFVVVVDWTLRSAAIGWRCAAWAALLAFTTFSTLFRVTAHIGL